MSTQHDRLIYAQLWDIRTTMNMAGATLAGHGPGVLFASSEAYPLAKTGGLGDVAGALPISLAGLGIDIRLIVPGYLCALDIAVNKRTLSPLPNGGRLILGCLPDSGLPVYLLDRPDLFHRSGGLYQDNEKCDWPDNHVRFAAFCDAVAQVARHGDGQGWYADLVHANDWHTGLVPALLASAPVPCPRTVFTIHNLAFQGNFPLDAAKDLGLPPTLLATDGAEFFGQFSFLKAGIRYGDRLTTVSPTYAREILTPEHGAGLDGLLRSRASDLLGILNGVDNTIWDSTCDRNLPACYNANCLEGKGVCKAAILNELGLRRSDDVPLICFVSRLSHQKMADVLLQALPALTSENVQLVLHGEGEKRLEDAFMVVSRDRPSQIAVRIGYQEALAHQLLAAADIALTPARFEPCGLTAMYAMLYGAPPVARPVGGLADSIISDASGANGDATGFMFAGLAPDELVACVRLACASFSDKARWHRIQRNAMQRDFSWNQSARRYAALYRDLLTIDARAIGTVQSTAAKSVVELDRYRSNVGAANGTFVRG